MADVLVAGAGVAGLLCAQALSGCGLRVAVLEAGPRAGGRATSWTEPPAGQAVDIGAHVLTSEHRNFLALLARLGTAQNICWQRQPLITLLDAGRPLRMHASGLPPPLHGLVNLRQALRCVSVADLASNQRIAWLAARLRDDEVLAFDRQDALALLREQGVSERFIRWFWASAVLAVLNVPLARCSGAAMLRMFRLLMGRSGYCFGFARTSLAELFVPGCAAAVERAGGSLSLGAQVQDVLLDAAGRFAGFGLADGRSLRADAGVLALPPPALARLRLQGAGGDRLRAAMQQAAGLAPVRYLSTFLWFDRKLTRERFWARVLAPGELNTDFYDLSNIRGDMPAGRSLVSTNAIGPHDDAWSWSDERIVARTCEELSQFVGRWPSAALRHASVHRIEMAVPAPEPGTESRRPQNDCGVPGLWLAGDWTATGLPCSMESAARSGALAAQALAAGRGLRLRVAQPLPGPQGLVALVRRRAPAGTALAGDRIR